MNTNFIDELTVVILTYKTNEEILNNCLKSIDKRVKVKIIENSKKFENEEKFLKKFSNLSIDCTGKNLGFGKGNNFGFRQIDTKYAFVLSPDTILDKDFFENIKKNGHRSYGYFSKNNLIKEHDETLIEADWIIGCAIIINLNKFVDKIVFDENIFIYFEDFDLCKTLINKGKKVFASKILFIKHIGNSSSIAIIPELKSASNKFRNWHWRWSEFYFYKKNYSYFYALRKCFFKLFKFIILMFYFKIRLNKEEFDKNKYSFLGLYNSIIGKKSFYRIEN